MKKTKTLHLKLEIDFSEWSEEIEALVLDGIRSTLTIFKRARWISDYSLKGGKLK